MVEINEFDPKYSINHYKDHMTEAERTIAIDEHAYRMSLWALIPQFQEYDVWCVNDNLNLDIWRYLPVKFGMKYIVSGEENNQLMLRETHDIPDLYVDPRRVRRREEVPAFVAEEVCKMRDYMKKLNDLQVSLGFPKTILDAGHYAEGMTWDVDNYPEQQTRRWNSETRQLEDGKDPKFEVPKPVPFEQPPETYTPFEPL